MDKGASSTQQVLLLPREKGGNYPFCPHFLPPDWLMSKGIPAMTIAYVMYDPYTDNQACITTYYIQNTL